MCNFLVLTTEQNQSSEERSGSWVSHEVPVQLHLLHLLHQSESATLEVGLEADVVLEDQRLVVLLVHNLRTGGVTII